MNDDSFMLPDMIHFEGTDFVVDPKDFSPEFVAHLKDIGRPGPADESVEYIMQNYLITGNEDDCKDYLRHYGAWHEEELGDHQENLRRLVWLSGCSLAENEIAYFSAY